jgi:hypothetical protein
MYSPIPVPVLGPNRLDKEPLRAMEPAAINAGENYAQPVYEPPVKENARPLPAHEAP